MASIRSEYHRFLAHLAQRHVHDDVRRLAHLVLDHLQPLLTDDATDAAWLRGMRRVHGNLNDVAREAAERLLARAAHEPREI